MDDEHALDIVELPQPPALYAGQVLSRALEYWRAFGRLTENEEKAEFPYASYFLFAHSLELFLKAFLFATGSTKVDLRKYEVRHDPVELLRLCTAQGLPEVANLVGLTATIREMNSDHDFRYPSNYNLHLPPPRFCAMVFEALREAGENTINQAAISANLQHASDTRHLRGKAKIRWSD